MKIGQNFIGPKGIAALCSSLLKNPTITQLDLSNNSISDIGARHIAEVIKNNKTLTYINLCYQQNAKYVGNTKILADGVKAILEALSHNYTIRTLNLSMIT